MKRFLAAALIIGASTCGIVGCTEEKKDETVRTVETPNGKVKETETVKVEKSGDAKDKDKEGMAPAATPVETPAKP